MPFIFIGKHIVFKCLCYRLSACSLFTYGWAQQPQKWSEVHARRLHRRCRRFVKVLFRNRVTYTKHEKRNGNRIVKNCVLLSPHIFSTWGRVIPNRFFCLFVFSEFKPQLICCTGMTLSINNEKRTNVFSFAKMYSWKCKSVACAGRANDRKWRKFEASCSKICMISVAMLTINQTLYMVRC